MVPRSPCNIIDGMGIPGVSGFENALSWIIETLEGRDIVWALTGSTSFALQGVPVNVHDIDIQTDARGAYAIQALFADKIERPVAFLESPNIRSHFGTAKVEGVTVEIMGAIQKRTRWPQEADEYRAPEWEPPVDVGALRIFIRWQGHTVPVLPLEYEYGAYVKLGRAEKAETLKRFMHRKAEGGLITVLCSTSPVARLADRIWSDPDATVEGVRRLGWPFVELRLWEEWNRPFIDIASQISRYADVLAVHAPPVTERLLCLPDASPARSVLQRCSEVATGCGAKVVVVHAWDLRLSNFDKTTLIRNLNDEAARLAESGIRLSIENIPGHSVLLPDIAASCPGVTFTIDTQWTTLENSWELVRTLTPRVDNVHVQSHISVTDDGPYLGRVSGGRFQPSEVLAGFVGRGFKGFLTLEPKGVSQNGEVHLTKALVMLKKLALRATR